MSMPYWINKANGKYYLHFKIDQTAGTKTTWTVTKNSDYSPEDPNTFWPFYDDFSGDSLSDNWDDSNVQGSYSVSDGTLNMWDNWGGSSGMFGNDYCDGSDYYEGIESTKLYDLPIRALIAFNQSPYNSVSGCTSTGVSIAYKKNEQIVTSTDSDNSAGVTWRIADSYDNGDVIAFPDDAPDNVQIDVLFFDRGIMISNLWDPDAQYKEFDKTPSSTTGQPLVIAGDTDSSDYIDHLDFIAVDDTVRVQIPGLSTQVIDDNTLLVTVDDTVTDNDENYEGYIITVGIDDWITSETENLEILDKTAYLLAKVDDTVYYYSSDDSTWKDIDKTVDDLTEDDFHTYGLTTPITLSKDEWDKLGSGFTLLTYSSDLSFDIMLNYTPLPQVVHVNESYNLNYVGEINNFVFSGSAYCLLSPDGDNWYNVDSSGNIVSYSSKSLDDIDADFIIDANTRLLDYNNINSDSISDIFNDKKFYIACALTENTDVIEPIKVNVDLEDQWIGTTNAVIATTDAGTNLVRVFEDGVYRIGVYK